MSDKRAILFANGELHQTAWLNSFLLPSDYLIAVDGGLNHLETLGLVPNLLIGDLDSVTEEQVSRAEIQGVKIERFPVKKDETDLELALLAAHKLGFRELIIAAALGGRLDQTLANLSLLLLPEIQDCQVRFEDGQEEIFLAHSSTQINGSPNDIVSLVPLWGAVTGVITQNLAFPLKNETLYPEHTRGISNTMTAASATVTTSSGDLLCIHIHPPKELK